MAAVCHIFLYLILPASNSNWNSACYSNIATNIALLLSDLKCEEVHDDYNMFLSQILILCQNDARTLLDVSFLPENQRLAHIQTLANNYFTHAMSEGIMA
jgi:hypothetical protein